MVLKMILVGGPPLPGSPTNTITILHISRDLNNLKYMLDRRRKWTDVKNVA